MSDGPTSAEAFRLIMQPKLDRMALVKEQMQQFLDVPLRAIMEQFREERAVGVDYELDRFEYESSEDGDRITIRAIFKPKLDEQP